MCHKLFHKTAERARAHIAHTRNKNDRHRGFSAKDRKKDRELVVYYCKECEGWHIGHTAIPNK